jgi:hypothetical protein
VFNADESLSPSGQKVASQSELTNPTPNPENDTSAIANPQMVAATENQNVPVCPQGHGKLREFRGRLRCWTCGATESSNVSCTAANRIDLVELDGVYTHNQRCGRPWMIAPFIIIALIVNYVAIAIGYLVGTVAGEFTGRVVDTLNDQPHTGQFDVLTSMFAGGLGLSAYCFCLMFTMDLCNHLTKNRSLKMAKIFGTITAVVLLAPVLFGLTVNATNFFYWLFLFFMFVTTAIVIRVSISTSLLPFCEACHSRMPVTYSRSFARSGEEILKLAKQGDVEKLSNMMETYASAGGSAEVELRSCENCRSYLRIWDVPENGNVIVAEGFVDEEAAELWRSILTPLMAPFVFPAWLSSATTPGLAVGK